MSGDVATLVDNIREAVSTHDNAKLEVLCGEFRQAAYRGELSAGNVKIALRALRSVRAFPLMRSVADASLASGIDDPQVRRQYAQALIDSGDLIAAEAVLDSLKSKLKPEEREFVEAGGLLGRLNKQKYIERAKVGAGPDAASLQTAIDHYLTIYRDNPGENTWHGVNAMALLARGRRDGLVLEGPDAAQLATDISDNIQRLWDDGEASPWDLATAMETRVALDDADGATKWLAEFVKEPNVGAFELASATRQLEEVWQVGPDSEMAVLLEVLQARMFERQEGTRFIIGESANSGVTTAAAVHGLEKTFGTVGAKSIEWFDHLLEIRRSVARIEHHDHEPVGTAWVVRGGDIVESFGDELMLMTNSHVVSDHPALEETLYPAEAWANFTHLAPGTRFDVDRVVYESPLRKLDATLLKMKQLPQGVPPLEMSSRLPLADGQQRVYVVGHLGGGDLRISIDDNILLDHDGTKLHYRAPTEPGSSGSPVLNRKLQVIALHHSGRYDMPKLNNKVGKYEANEGIALRTIRDDASRRPGV